MRRKRVSLCIIMACGLLAGSVPAAVAQDDTLAVSTSLSLGYVSKYVWRGIPQTTEGAFQPSLTFAGDKGYSLNVWASYDNDAGELREVDYTGDYTWSAAGVEMSAGVIHYAFPNTNFSSTTEVYLGVGFDAPLSPTAKLYYDFREADGFYLSLGGSHSLSLGEEGNAKALDLAASVGLGSSDFNDFYFGQDKTALVDFLLSASMSFPMGESGAIMPSLSYTRLLDSKLKGGVADPDSFFGGVTVSFDF